MTRRRCGPPAFVLTGFGWLLVMAATGMALYAGTVRSTPLPATLRLIHAHGALLGGLLQLLVGGLLDLRRSLGLPGSTSHWGRYLALNLGTIGMLAGFWFRHYPWAAVGGIVALGPLIPLCGDVWRLARQGRLGSGWSSWYAAFAIGSFVFGSLFGVLYSFSLVPPDWMIHARLGHVHLVLQGFLLVVLIGITHQLTVSLLRAPLWSSRLGTATMAMVLLGVAGLLAGFGLGRIPVQLAAGSVLLLATLALGYNLLRSWLSSTQPSSIASDHLLLGVLFLVLTMVMGLLVAVNVLFEPRLMPFGRLHMVAYTHMMFVGCVLHLVYGTLTWWVPDLLATDRVTSHKKQSPYAARLLLVMNRWRALQLGALSMGTMGLVAVAALTWQHPMGSPVIQRTTWVSIGLLLAVLALFAAKIGMLWGTRPDEQESR